MLGIDGKSFLYLVYTHLVHGLFSLSLLFEEATSYTAYLLDKKKQTKIAVKKFSSPLQSKASV